jgi:hypothetical protein
MHHPFAEEIRTLLANYPSGRSVIVYSRPTEVDLQGVHYDFAGHLDLALLKK